MTRFLFPDKNVRKGAKLETYKLGRQNLPKITRNNIIKYGTEAQTVFTKEFNGFKDTVFTKNMPETLPDSVIVERNRDTSMHWNGLRKMLTKLGMEQATIEQVACGNFDAAFLSRWARKTSCVQTCTMIENALDSVVAAQVVTDQNTEDEEKTIDSAELRLKAFKERKNTAYTNIKNLLTQKANDTNPQSETLSQLMMCYLISDRAHAVNVPLNEADFQDYFSAYCRCMKNGLFKNNDAFFTEIEGDLEMLGTMVRGYITNNNNLWWQRKGRFGVYAFGSAVCMLLLCMNKRIQQLIARTKVPYLLPAFVGGCTLGTIYSLYKFYNANVVQINKEIKTDTANVDLIKRFERIVAAVIAEHKSKDSSTKTNFSNYQKGF